MDSARLCKLCQVSATGRDGGGSELELLDTGEGGWTEMLSLGMGGGGSLELVWRFAAVREGVEGLAPEEEG